ncbi:maleylpyruvate isomerase family mycothiol-dependent enzyme [Tomitella fengzijianii]|uniref:Maleylpyruvate isomerase family mycothiol-dependent enzyme n=1 Tax=Tomitella fengzijianii TaxID=2597660 RepID=A0A516X7U7_9ACTN|nr:maleylpyruvate isomerase family mycothiol-dependent enzyme [Tomitella fengzijianii]
MTRVDRDAVQAALFEQWSVLEQLLRTLDAGQWQAPTALPGWTVHDTAAHIIGTESMLDGQDTPPAPAGATPAGHVRNPIGEVNERWVLSMRPVRPADLMDRWTALLARRRHALEEMPQEDFDAETATPVGPESYGRFMRIRLFDCWMHEIDIRDAVARPGDEGGARGELAFAEIAGAVPFIVGKKAGAPDGARVRLTLTDPMPRTLDVQVSGGRAALAPIAGEPDVTVTMPSGVFVRLAGGRVTADEVGERIRVDAGRSGAMAADDAVALGRRIPESLAFTI